MNKLIGKEKYIAIAFVLALSGCASIDAAHIAGQNADLEKYRIASEVNLQRALSVETCYKSAKTEMSHAFCTFQASIAGITDKGPTPTVIAPTAMQSVGSVLSAAMPYAAGAYAAGKISAAVAKDPVIVQTPDPVIVNPVIVRVP